MRHVAKIGVWLLLVGLFGSAVACGGGDAVEDGSVDAMATIDGGPGTFDPDGGRTPPTTTCQDFEFLASGRGACNEGCTLSCDCPEGSPISIVSCQPDGCIVSANCTVACDEGAGAATACVETYKVPE